MIPQKWKPWLALTLIFVVGMVTGGALTVAFSPVFLRPPGEQQRQHHLMEFLTRRLDLTPDQQAKIQPILADASRQMQGVHREEVGRITQILEKSDAQIATVLTPDQQVRLQALEKDRDKMFPGHMHPWRPHGGPEDLPPPPPGAPDDAPPPPDNSQTNAAPVNPGQRP